MRKKILSLIMTAMMAVAFCVPMVAFADEAPTPDSFIWNDDGTVTYIDQYGEDYKASVSTEVEDASCESDGLITYTATFADKTDTMTKVIPAFGHEYSDTSVWAIVDNEAVKVFRCKTCGDEQIDNRMTPIPATFIDDKNATCEDEGIIAHYEGGDRYFIVDENDAVTEVLEEDVITPALGHKYQVKYTFADDGSKCDAKATCSVCGDVVRSNAEITKEVTKEATSTEKGETTYTATFYTTDKDGNKVEDPTFKTQTKTIANIDYVWEATWSNDYTKCVAEKNGEKVGAEEITAVTANGITTYTATFKKDSGIGPFTADVENTNPITVTGKTVKAKASKKTTVKASKAITVKNAEGDVTYTKVSGNKKITVAKNGKITVKKGLKKGKTYTVKVKVSASGNDNYVAGDKTVTVKVKVKK